MVEQVRYLFLNTSDKNMTCSEPFHRRVFGGEPRLAKGAQPNVADNDVMDLIKKQRAARATTARNVSAQAQEEVNVIEINKSIIILADRRPFVALCH